MQPLPDTPGWLTLAALTCLAAAAICMAGLLTTLLHTLHTRPRQKGPQ